MGSARACPPCSAFRRLSSSPSASFQRRLSSASVPTQREASFFVMANKGGKGGPQMQAIDLTKLNLMQLTQFKNSLDQDLQFYQESLQNLKHAQSKFQESSESLQRCAGGNGGKDILVPLTGSMYVPGKLSDSVKVIVEIGTGYYVEKDVPATREYFAGKVKYVTEQMEKVQAVGQEKSKIREAVMDVMESKLSAQFQQQKLSAGAAGTSQASS